MENYFNYFTEIEEHFQRRWGGILRLSPLDWALIETWKDAGIPLQAVLRGIDTTFENHQKRTRTKKVNGLGFCSQEVLAAAEEMKEAAAGTASAPEKARRETGFEAAEIAAFLRRNAARLDNAALPERQGVSAQIVAREAASRLQELAAQMETPNSAPRLEELEYLLTALEEKLFAALVAATAEHDIASIRAEADRELASYRRKMQAAQIAQLHKQYLQKKLLEKYRLPRLSLFYM